MYIGIIIVNLIWFSYGIFLIFFSIINKEKLRDKATLGRLLGAIFILLAFINALITII
jgi:hypothetical protein